MAGKKPGYDAVMATPFGRVGIRLAGGALVDVSFLARTAPLTAPRSAAARRTCAGLRAYFADARHAFGLPLAPRGTRFQRRVWRALVRIPAGQVLSYGRLARRLKTSARAVGNACRANPLPIVIPCHRVVGARGPGGFMGRRAGAPLRLKQRLLEHERAR